MVANTQHLSSDSENEYKSDVMDQRSKLQRKGCDQCRLSSAESLKVVDLCFNNLYCKVPVYRNKTVFFELVITSMSPLNVFHSGRSPGKSSSVDNNNHLINHFMHATHLTVTKNADGFISSNSFHCLRQTRALVSWSFQLKGKTCRKIKEMMRLI